MNNALLSDQIQMIGCMCRGPDQSRGPGPHRVPGAGQECSAGATVEGEQQRERLGLRGRIQGGPHRVHQ